jgi:C_GCAxxG_C_C family probable redox protein
MKIEEIQDLFAKEIDCSQVVAGEFAEELGMDRETLWKLTSCYGGGMMCGETCGTVTGALMVIGMKYGHSKPGDHDRKMEMMAKVSEFKKRFHEKYPSCLCRDLLGHDISQPGELDKVLEEGLMMSFCPYVASDVIEILKDIIRD